MAKLSAYGSTVVVRLEKEIPTSLPFDKAKITYCFTSDGRLLLKNSWHLPADEYRLKPKWDTTGYRLRGRLKKELDPRDSFFYKNLLSNGYKEVTSD